MNAEEILLEKNYVIKIVNEDVDLYHVTFPSQRLVNKKALQMEVFYALTDDEVHRMIGEDGDEASIELPKYAQRLFMNLDISHMTHELGLSPELMVVFDNEGAIQREIPGIVEGDDLGREAMLQSLFFEALEEGFPKKFTKEAKRLGVLDAYKVLADLHSN